MHQAPLQGSRRFVAAVLTLFAVMGWLARPQVATAAVNLAPWINGSPPKYVTAGSAYWFEPSSADLNGQTLKFSIAGKPAWATFSTNTGRLSGTPPITAAGKKFGGISIRATDGQLNAKLPKFSIIVVAPTSNSVTLSWRAPTQNVDGTGLTDLMGYHVAYGTASRSYDTLLYIEGASVTSAVIEGLPRGQYFFAVKAVNSAGTTSDFSNEAQKWL
jgi:hypothetical protein